MTKREDNADIATNVTKEEPDVDVFVVLLRVDKIEAGVRSGGGWFNLKDSEVDTNDSQTPIMTNAPPAMA